MEHLKTFTHVVYGTFQNCYKCIYHVYGTSQNFYTCRLWNISKLLQMYLSCLWNISKLLHMSSMEHLKTFTNAVGRVEHEIITLLVHVQTQWNMYLCKLYGT